MQGKSTMKTAQEQLIFDRAQRLQARLAKTRDRLRQRSRMQQIRAKARTTIRITVGLDTAERAEEGCFAALGVNLSTWLKDEIASFADLIPRDGKTRVNRRWDVASDQEREWLDILSAYLDELPPHAQVSAQELFETGAGNQGMRASQEDLIRIGRVMKRLRWRRSRIARDGKRLWVYRKPADAQTISPKIPSNAPSAGALEPVKAREPTPNPYADTRSPAEVAAEAARRRKIQEDRRHAEEGIAKARAEWRARLALVQEGDDIPVMPSLESWVK